MNENKNPITSVGNKWLYLSATIMLLELIIGGILIYYNKEKAGAVLFLAAVVAFIITIVIALILISKKQNEMMSKQASKLSEEQSAHCNTQVSDEFVNKHRKFDDIVDKFNGDKREAIKYILLKGTTEEINYYTFNEFTHEEKAMAYDILAELPTIKGREQKFKNPYVISLLYSILKLIIINGLLFLIVILLAKHKIKLSDKWIDILAYSIPTAFCSMVALDVGPKIVDCFRYWKIIRKIKSLLNYKSK